MESSKGTVSLSCGLRLHNPGYRSQRDNDTYKRIEEQGTCSTKSAKLMI